MKKYNPLLKVFVATLIVGLFVITCRKKPPEAAIEYEESVGPITLKDKVIRSYRINYEKNLNENNAFEIAKQLTDISTQSLDFAPESQAENGIVTLRTEADPSAVFEMDMRSGNFLYNGGLAAYKSVGDTPKLITGEKADALALKHLEKLDLSPSEQELLLANQGGLDMAVLKDDGTTEVFKKLVTVRYKRKLADIPVKGESRIVVQMAENGKLAGLIYNWGEIQEEMAIASDAVLSDRELKKELESRLRAAAIGCKRIVVQKADYVLYDDAKGRIEPAFYIQAKLYYELPKGEGEESQTYDVPYDYYIPILKEPQAFYPFMDMAKVLPEDVQESTITPQDDE